MDPYDKESDIVEQIVNTIECGIDNFVDVIGTLEKYALILQLFVKILAIANVNTIYNSLIANIYYGEYIFLKKILSEKNSTTTPDLVVSLTKRMNRAHYMNVNFNQRYIMMTLETSTINDERLNLNIQQLNENVLKIIKKLQTNQEIFVEGFLVNAFERVSDGYCTGIDGFLRIDKKLATYYGYMAYFFHKTSECNDKDHRKIYDDLLEKYLDARNDNITMDFVIDSFSKVKN